MDGCCHVVSTSCVEWVDLGVARVKTRCNSEKSLLRAGCGEGEGTEKGCNGNATTVGTPPPFDRSLPRACSRHFGEPFRIFCAREWICRFFPTPHRTKARHRFCRSGGAFCCERAEEKLIAGALRRTVVPDRRSQVQGPLPAVSACVWCVRGDDGGWRFKEEGEEISVLVLRCRTTRRWSACFASTVLRFCHDVDGSSCFCSFA